MTGAGHRRTTGPWPRLGRIGLAATALLACGPSDPVDGGKTPDDSADVADTAPTSALRFVLPPRVAQARDDAILTWSLVLATDVATRVDVALDAGDEVLHRAFPEYQRSHDLPLVELLPDTAFAVTVTATAADGSTATAGLELTTEPLPSRFPTFEVVAHAPDRMEPGLTLFPVQAGPDLRWITAIDGQLRVRMLFRMGDKVDDLRLGDDGLLWMVQPPAVAIWDVRGTVQRRYDLHGDAGDLPAPMAFHHEVLPGADGGFVALGERSVTVDAYPRERDPSQLGGEARVQMSAVLELAADGTVRTEVDLADVLDLHRIGFDSHDLTPFGFDHHHANAVIPWDDDHWLVSLRHQDALVKVGHDGVLDWILANPDGWGDAFAAKRLQPVGDLAWPFHQHAPERLPDGGLLVFDNGNHRATPYGPPSTDPPYTRIVVYDIDETAGTVSERWSVDGSPLTGRLYAPAMGDADLQPLTGNVLATHGFLWGEEGWSNVERGRGDTHARLIEFHPDTPDDPALDLRLWSPREVAADGWRVYRAERVPRLHESVVR